MITCNQQVVFRWKDALFATPQGAAERHSGRLRDTKWAFHGQDLARFFAFWAPPGEDLFPLLATV